MTNTFNSYQNDKDLDSINLMDEKTAAGCFKACVAIAEKFRRTHANLARFNFNALVDLPNADDKALFEDWRIICRLDVEETHYEVLIFDNRTSPSAMNWESLWSYKLIMHGSKHNQIDRDNFLPKK